MNGENLVAFRLIEAATKKCAAVAPSLLRERPRRLQATPSKQPANQIRVTIKPYCSGAGCILPTYEETGNFCPSPFVIMVNHCNVNEDSIPSVAVGQLKVAVAVALYNMALACHIQYKTIQCTEKVRILSDRARILYHKAAKLLFNSSDRDQEHMELFLAICINACGEAQDQGDLEQIRFWLTKFDQASHTVKEFSSLTPYLLQRHVFYIGQFCAAGAA
jgi:hypothetical protein